MKVLVVIARGLQLGALGCYGNPWIETPSLDGLAATGVVFDQHFADNAQEAGARRAWRTGRYQLPAPGDQAPNQGDDLPRRLRERGIATCLILDDSRPAPAEFAEGWDQVERIAADQEGQQALELTIEAAAAALERLADRNDWLLWIDLATLLPPWNVSEEFQAPYFAAEPAANEEAGEPEDEEEADEEEEEEENEFEEKAEPLTPITEVTPGPIDSADDTLYLRLWSSYASAVSCLDAGIGQLIDSVAARDGDDEVRILITTDCGHPLGEHGIVGPVQPWPHDEMIHLPLLLRLPGNEDPGRRVSALTQAVDLAPTLADLFGVTLEAAHGHSLLPLVHGKVELVRPYACAGVEVGEIIEWALRTPDWALLLQVRGQTERGMQLYVKPDDRWEVNNVVQHHLELAEQMEKALYAFVGATREAGPLTVPPLPDLDASPSRDEAGKIE